MKNINIGIATLFISNKLKESQFNNKLIVETNKITSNFFDVIKNSPILQLEFKVLNNIENKFINDDQIATRYIDNNVKLFETYTIEEINIEHGKLTPFIDESVVDVNDKKIQLYVSIINLINESLGFGENVDVDKIHESFGFVLKHIKTPKQSLTEDINSDSINEDVIKLAITKFNEKYESLDEYDKKLLKTILDSKHSEKEQILESHKKEILIILEEINNKNTEDNITKAIQKIKEMVYSGKDVDDNLIKLHELKKDII